MSLQSAAGTMSEEAQWLNYSPQGAEGKGYNSFLGELGFHTSKTHKRVEFVKDFTAHVDFNTFRYARQSENKVEFHKMVLAFLTKHGAKYWGAAERGHLDEADPNKGYLYPRDAQRSPSRLVEVLEAMFEYKAKGVHNYDQRAESVLPHLDLHAMTWPPRDDPTIESQGKRSTVTINRTPSFSFKWTVLQRSWEPSGAQRRCHGTEPYEDEELPVSRDRKSRPRARVIDYDEDSDFGTPWPGSEDTELAKPPQPIRLAKNRDTKRDRGSSDNPLDERLRKKPRHRVLSPRRETASSLGRVPSRRENTSSLGRALSPRRKTTSSLGQRSDSVPAPNSKSRRGVQQPTPQSARLNMNAEISDSESDVVVLNDVPRRSKIKEERTSVKKEPFSVEITHGTHLIISASNQPDMAPVKTLLGSVSNIEQLYGKLAKDCELQTDRSERSKRIIAVSVTFPWSNEKYRLRKGEDEDWRLFKSDLENAWARNSGFKKEGCKVLMLLHVDI